MDILKKISEPFDEKKIDGLKNPEETSGFQFKPLENAPEIDLKPVHSENAENAVSPPPENEIVATPVSDPPISENDDITGNPAHEETKNEVHTENDSPKRGRGRPPGSKSAPKPPDILTADPEKQLMGVAGMTFDLTSGMAASIFGETWVKEKYPGERNFVVNAIANYYRETGVTDLPPKTALVLAVAAYSLPRLSEPGTKDKIKIAFIWVKEKISKIFKRK